MKNGGGYFEIIEETAEIVLFFDEAGHILYGNRAALDKLGYTKEELAVCGMAKLFRQEFQLKDGVFQPFHKEVLAAKTESAIYRKNSSCFDVSMRFFTAADGTDYLLAEDITWRKTMDVRIRQVKEEEKANRQVKNEFTANVTHELRTPVNGIRGHATMLLDAETDAAKRQTLQIILNCCDTMSAIINNILDFSKMEAGKFTIEEAEFDFYEMMDQVIATHMPEINKKELYLKLDIAKNVPRRLIGDSLRIGQILHNLLSNAVKFTQVGYINVDVSVVSAVNDTVELFFMVRDSGIGISKEEQDKLFESYRQADASITRRFGGTGLGLTIAKQLVELMNGSIFVESEKGRGSCFSFNIWLHTAEIEGESEDMAETFQNWSDLTEEIKQFEPKRLYEFGSKENKAELTKRMEKLVLSIEMGYWDKAETLAEALKLLTEKTDMKQYILRLEMAIRKGDYEKSMAAYEKFKAALAEHL